MKEAVEIIKTIFSFMKNPTGYAVFIVCAVLLFVGYVLPLGLMAWVYSDGTNRTVEAIRESCMGNRVATKQTTQQPME